MIVRSLTPKPIGFMHYRYIIVGGGLAAASAVEGIREHDRESPILMVSRENHPPYHRPPLSKGLWFGKETRDDLPVHADSFYDEHGVTLALRHEVIELNAASHTIWDDRGASYEYEKLLLATGGKPTLLDADISPEATVNYYRSLEDYLALHDNSTRFRHALVVGGGFIGLEVAAALRHSGMEVTLIYRGEYPLRKVLPRDLGVAVADLYRSKGVETVSNDGLRSLSEAQGLLHGVTEQGNIVSTQMVMVGIGITPHTELADAAGLDVGRGIVVDAYTRTSEPDIHAAGDVTEFPCVALNQRMQVEHWDHAKMHGRAAGENMAGASRVYDHLPMFYSDFFEVGWEAVGDIDAGLDVAAVWKKELEEGILFYVQNDVVRGVLLWNSWDKVDWARDLIRRAQPMTRAEREAAIPAD